VSSRPQHDGFIVMRSGETCSFEFCGDKATGLVTLSEVEWALRRQKTPPSVEMTVLSVREKQP